MVCGGFLFLLCMVCALLSCLSVRAFCCCVCCVCCASYPTYRLRQAGRQAQLTTAAAQFRANLSPLWPCVELVVCVCGREGGKTERINPHPTPPPQPPTINLVSINRLLLPPLATSSQHTTSHRQKNSRPAGLAPATKPQTANNDDDDDDGVQRLLTAVAEFR